MEPMRRVPIRKGVELAVSVLEGESPAVVLLHGGLGNRFSWRSQFEWAQRLGWRAGGL